MKYFEVKYQINEEVFQSIVCANSAEDAEALAFDTDNDEEKVSVISVKCI